MSNNFPLKATVPRKDAVINASKVTALIEGPIVAAARAYTEADVHVTPGSMKYSLVVQQDAFARVAVSDGESGYAHILKKSHDIWVVIASGQDLPGQAAADKYGLPAGWFSTEY